MRMLSFHAPPELVRALDAFADRLDVSRAEAIRTLLIRGLAHPSTGAAVRKLLLKEPT